MRAARLLQILLLLQNRGRQTSVQLADELEVAPRTILRDVDAMTEAGLPIIVHQGNRGGLELGFNYRTRLTGLAQDEAEALGLILAATNPMLSTLELTGAAARARAKLVESFPDKTRGFVQDMMTQFTIAQARPVDDLRINAISKAVRGKKAIRLQFASPNERLVHPTAMHLDDQEWSLRDALSGDWIPMKRWGRVNISSHNFT